MTVLLNAVMRKTIAQRASEDLVQEQLSACENLEYVLAEDILNTAIESLVMSIGTDGYSKLKPLLPVREYIYIHSPSVGVKKLSFPYERSVPGEFLDSENPPESSDFDGRLSELSAEKLRVATLHDTVYKQVKEGIVDQCSTLGSLVGKWPSCTKYLDQDWGTFEGEAFFESLKNQIAE